MSTTFHALYHMLLHVKCNVIRRMSVVRFFEIFMLFATTFHSGNGENLAFQPLSSTINKFDSSSSYPLYGHTSCLGSQDCEEDIPIILWWTGRLFLGEGLTVLRCPNSNCYSTGDRKYFKDPRLRGIFIYGTDLDPEDLPIPRGSLHEWALYHEESPMNNYMLTHHTMLQLFNHTATFRRESDYPLTSQSIISNDYILGREPVSLAVKNQKRKEGLAPIVYVQSHCDVASDRDRYVQELMKYIDIDSLGSCLNNKNLDSDLVDPVESMAADRFYDVLANYKFHLAFENALCEDYITEKLFRPLHVGAVPIHRGSPTATDWMPNNQSLILADDFESPESLAQFIKYLDSHDQEYQQYLRYKTSGIENQQLALHLQTREWGSNDWNRPDSLSGFECHICDQIAARHERENAHRNDPDITLLPPKLAKANHLYCVQPYPSVGDITDLHSDDKLEIQLWIDDYWNGLDKAKAIQKMLENNETDSTLFIKYWEDIMRAQGLY